MSIENALYFKNRQEWRKWLEVNSGSALEAWLVHYKKQSLKTSVSLSDAVEEAIRFGWIDSKMKSVDEEQYILRYSPRKPKSIWSKINKERAERLIESGRMTSAGLAKIEEAKENGLWQTAYTSRKQENMPDDLKMALMDNSSAWSNFQNFANSYRNMYIGWINDARTKETRMTRITEVVKRSVMNKRPGII